MENSLSQYKVTLGDMKYLPEDFIFAISARELNSIIINMRSNFEKQVMEGTESPLTALEKSGLKKLIKEIRESVVSRDSSAVQSLEVTLPEDMVFIKKTGCEDILRYHNGEVNLAAVDFDSFSNYLETGINADIRGSLTDGEKLLYNRAKAARVSNVAYLLQDIKDAETAYRFQLARLAKVHLFGYLTSLDKEYSRVNRLAFEDLRHKF